VNIYKINDLAKTEPVNQVPDSTAEHKRKAQYLQTGFLFKLKKKEQYYNDCYCRNHDEHGNFKTAADMRKQSKRYAGISDMNNMKKIMKNFYLLVYGKLLADDVFGDLVQPNN
jgi:hypothetical protein